MNDTHIRRIGFVAGLAACTAAVAYDVAQVLQLVGALHFPLDEILIFGTSFCIIPSFVAEILAFYYSRAVHTRFWTRAALVCAIVYAVFATTNYVVQLTIVIPAKLRGTVNTVRFLEQTPHSLMWDFDAAAYIAMGLTTLVVIPSLRTTGTERWVRVACAANVAATVLAGIVYFYPTYSAELLLLGIPWGITAPVFMALLGMTLRTGPSEAAA